MRNKGCVNSARRSWLRSQSVAGNLIVIGYQGFWASDGYCLFRTSSTELWDANRCIRLAGENRVAKAASEINSMAWQFVEAQTNVPPEAATPARLTGVWVHSKGQRYAVVEIEEGPKKDHVFAIDQRYLNLFPPSAKLQVMKGMVVHVYVDGRLQGFVMPSRSLADGDQLLGRPVVHVWEAA